MIILLIMKVLMKNKILILFIAFAMSSSLKPLTITNNLSKWTTIDIYISQKKMTRAALISPTSFNPDAILVNYSLMPNSLGQISVWQTIFTPDINALTPTASQHFTLPTKMENPCILTITQEELQTVARKELNEVFVYILQRTYAYDFVTKKAAFFANKVLMEEFKSLDAEINVEASGLIAESQFNRVPPHLRGMYPLAIGSSD